ncbi:MAG: CapA family protein [bacterium]|nr:CapA family protein [bacterium]
MAGKTPRWFRAEDRSARFNLDCATGVVTPPDRVQEAGESVRLYASGDVIWERDLMADVLPLPAEHPLGQVREVWRDGDIVFAQQETCFGPERGERWEPGKRISYLTDPALLPHFLAGGFNLACLASNHTMDYGLGPIEYTRARLTENGVAVSGSGANLEAARVPAIIEVKGKRVALLSYASDDEVTNARVDREGNAFFRRDLVIEDVEKARSHADIVLVSVHKGREFVYFPSPEHQDDCRAIIDAGADVILGHHPHFMQGIEWRRRNDGRQGLIFYSLGSLLVDYEPPLSKYELELFRRSQRNNYVARIDIDDLGVSGLQLTPIRQTDDWSVRTETDDERAETFALVEQCCHPVNHDPPCRKFWVTGWSYLAIQYPSIWMHLKNRPSYFGNALRWFFREETFRLQWGAIFAREVPAWLLDLRRGFGALMRWKVRLVKRMLGRG